MSYRPYLTSGVAGIGGVWKSRPEDFRVVEHPLYEPSGEGQHLYVEVEKRGLTTDELVRLLAGHFGFDRREIGVAGRKDKHAVTRQWLSLPAHLMGTTDVVGPVTEDVTILNARLHGNKLRTGHLSGNAFELVIRDLECDDETALERARETLRILNTAGAPNYYGMQRFGHGGSTVEIGLGLLADDDAARRRVRGKRRLKKLAFNAVQSAVFNSVLASRIADGTVATPMLGDRIEWIEERRFMRADDADELEMAQRAVEAGDAAITGPMPGPRHPEAAGEPRRIELEAYESWGVTDDAFKVAKKLARGTRRPFSVAVRGAEVSLAEAGCLRLAFFLPSGSYATVVLREMMKHENEGPDA